MNVNSVPAAGTPEHAQATASHQVLSFELAGQTYGIDIRKVQEVRSYAPPVRVPSSPPWLLGVTNLRGRVMPVVDLRTHLGLPGRFDDRPVTAVLGLGAQTAEIVVDAVSDVLEIPLQAVQPLPTHVGATGNYVLGLASVQRSDTPQSLILLDPEALVTSFGIRAKVPQQTGVEG